MAKMRAPVGMTGISFQGVEIKVEKGLAEIPEHLAEEARAHGFAYVGDGGPIDVSRSGLIHHIVESVRAVAENAPDEILMNFRAIPEDLKVEFWDRFRNSLREFHEEVSREPQPEPQPEPQNPAEPAKK